MSKRFLALLVVIAAVFVGLILVNRDNSTNNQTTDASPSNHVQGEGTSGVTLVEYGDFQCPACAGYYPVLNQVKEKYGDQIKFQFRHFPIVSSHPNAMAAHRAAEAAARQDKFWEMHNMLYERQDFWKDSNNAPSVFEGYANELGLNIEQYKQDVADPATKEVIDADVREATRLNVQATPTFFLNGEKVESNLRTLDDFSKLIDEAAANDSQ